MTLTFTNLPKMSTSHLREITWSIDWYKQSYFDAKAQSELAWKIYDDAIENEDPREQINVFFEVAAIFDATYRRAWRKWQNAKRDYLALLN